ncbi:unnamed protein product [Closterium sp. NIES-54]
MAFTSSTLSNPITPLHLEADDSSFNFKAWSYGVDKHLLSRDVQGLDLKDILLNRGKGKQPPLPIEPTNSASDADMRAYEDAADKHRKWEKADAAIISVFIGSTPPELVNTFHNYTTSNAIWKYLQDRFMNKTAVGVAILIPSMLQVRLEDCSGMADYIAKVHTIHGELKELGIVFPEQAPAVALLVGLTSTYEVTRKILITSSAEDLTFAKVSSALLSTEKDSTAQAKAYALRAPVPQASVASAPFQCNRFPPCTYVVKYGNRKGQDPASASASDSAPADVRINLLFLGTTMINEANSQYIGSSQVPQYIELTLDSRATHTVLKETFSFKPYSTPIPLLGADSSFTILAKGSSTVPCPAFPSGTVTGMCVPSLLHNILAQQELQKAGLRTIISEYEDYCDVIDPLTNKVLARFTLNSSGLYMLRVPIPQVSTTQAQTAITPCSCRGFSNPTILYHHRLGHPKFRTLADMASKKLLLGLPASLPPPPNSPAPTCLDCTKSKLRQQPHPASPSVAAAPLDLLGKTPTARPLRVWGCTACVLLNPQDRQRQGDKLGPKTQTCIYLGHNADSPDYLFLNLSTQQLVRSRDFVFDETRPFYSTSGEDPPSGPPSLVWADFDAPPALPPAPAPSPPTSLAIAPSPSEVSNPTSLVSSAAAPPSPPSPTLPTAPPLPSAPITYHRRSNPPAPPPPPVPTIHQEPALPPSPELITYQRRPLPPPRPPKPSPPGTPAPPSSPVAHGTQSHRPVPPLAFAIRCSVITPTPPAGGDVPSTLLEDRHEELCDLHAVIPQLSHIFPDITTSPSLNFSENPTIPIPLTVQEALSGPHAAEWRAAMEAECEAFTRNHSFDDETPPPGVNIVGGKWLFRVKQLSDEAPVFKARYVAKGFTQQQYIDFFKTFSPTSKPPTIRTL